LGNEPEIRHTNSGKVVVNFNIACSSGYGEKQETEWFRVVCWEKLAEICGEALHKGSRVQVVGRMKSNEWTDKEGNKHESKDTIASSVLFLDRKEGNSGTSAPRRESRKTEEDRDF
jgi:single-strand DNA-binding protein